MPEPSGAGLLLPDDAGLAHPRHLMQRRPSLGGGVRIGAAIQQPRGELVVGIRGGEQERVEADLGVRPWSVRRRRAVAGRAPGLTGSESFMSAPAFISASPRRSGLRGRQTDSAVNPPFERALNVRAARDERLDHRGHDPRRPPTSARSARASLLSRSGSAPCASSTFTASTFPVRAATMSAVSPSADAVSASAPASSSISIAPRCR